MEYRVMIWSISQINMLQNGKQTRKAPRVGANSSSVLAFDMHKK